MTRTVPSGNPEVRSAVRSSGGHALLGRVGADLELEHRELIMLRAAGLNRADVHHAACSWAGVLTGSARPPGD